MGQLDCKTALITGGARGFGRAIALLLAREGADVAIADIGHNLPSQRFTSMASEDNISQTAQELEALGRKAIGIQADVPKAADCQRMAETVMEVFGKIDILCANAGVETLAPAWELTEEEWDCYKMPRDGILPQSHQCYPLLCNGPPPECVRCCCAPLRQR